MSFYFFKLQFAFQLSEPNKKMLIATVKTIEGLKFLSKILKTT